MRLRDTTILLVIALSAAASGCQRDANPRPSAAGSPPAADAPAATSAGPGETTSRSGSNGSASSSPSQAPGDDTRGRPQAGDPAVSQAPQREPPRRAAGDPPTLSNEDIVRLVTQPRSHHTSDRGFLNYRFGMSERDAERVSRFTDPNSRDAPANELTGPRSESVRVNEAGWTLRFAEGKGLVAIAKQYEDDNAGTLLGIREALGPADKESIETFQNTEPRTLHKVTRVTYRLPRIIAAVFATEFHHRTGPRRKHDERLTFAVFDSSWVQDQLRRDLDAKRRVLLQAAAIWQRLEGAGGQPKEFPAWPGAVCKSGVNSDNHPFACWFDPDQPDSKLSLDQIRFDSLWFCQWATNVTAAPNLPAAASRMLLRFGQVPKYPAVELATSHLQASVVVEATAGLVQDVFPPHDGTVTLRTKAWRYFKAHDWVTRDGLVVQVESPFEVRISRPMKKKL